MDEWQKVFFIGAGIYMFGWIMFVIFADAEVQDWAKGRTDEKSESETRISRSKGDPIYYTDVIAVGYKDTGTWDKAVELDVCDHI